MKRNLHITLITMLFLALSLILAAHAEQNPVIYLEGQQTTESEESYFGSWAFACAVNDFGEFSIDGISADTYFLSIGPGWYQESISGQLSAYPTIHAGSKLMCLYRDDSETPAYFRLYLSEDGRLFTPMGTGESAFTVYFTRIDDAPGAYRGEEIDDRVVGGWLGAAPAGSELPSDGEGVLTFRANGAVAFDNGVNNCVGFWRRDEAGIEAVWAHYKTDRWSEADGCLVSDIDGAVYAPEHL